MLKFRVIPIILVDGPNVVKGSEFNNWRKVGTLIPALNVYNTRDVDELILLDTRASRSHTDFNMRILAQALGRISVPLAVGGGITSVDQVAEADRQRSRQGRNR
jgi:imidazole glycerol-phosphate synthase subunit HisF